MDDDELESGDRRRPVQEVSYVKVGENLLQISNGDGNVNIYLMGEDSSSGPTRSLEFLEASSRAGHSNPSTRWSAFAALEQIGVEDPRLRQGVIDQICQYLRAPVREEPEEQKLRLHLQNILRRRLTKWDENYDLTDGVWEGVALDLSGAELVDFTLYEGSLDRATFAGAHFSGSCDFGEARFLYHADFSNAVFDGNAYFNGCGFSMSGADFSQVEFRGGCSFSRTHFEGMADFAGAVFWEEPSFLKANFSELATYEGASFGGGANFECACFRDDVSFEKSEFNAGGYFIEAYFKKAVSFCGVSPVENIDLSRALAEPAYVRRVWPEGWGTAFDHCLVIAPDNERESVISRDGPGSLCRSCRPKDVCRYAPVEQN